MTAVGAPTGSTPVTGGFSGTLFGRGAFLGFVFVFLVLVLGFVLVMNLRRGGSQPFNHEVVDPENLTRGRSRPAEPRSEKSERRGAPRRGSRLANTPLVSGHPPIGIGMIDGHIVCIGVALADPTRVRLVRALEDRSHLTVGDLAARLGVARGTVHHHLGLLERASMVAVDRVGRRRYPRLLLGPWLGLLRQAGTR